MKKSTKFALLFVCFGSLLSVASHLFDSNVALALSIAGAVISVCSVIFAIVNLRKENKNG